MAHALIYIIAVNLIFYTPLFSLIMIGAFWILAFTVVVGIVLYAFELRWRKKHFDINESDNLSASEDSNPNSSIEEEDCCGLHLVCEKDSLSPMSADIIYYDDEELDRFVGRDPSSYSNKEEEEFREILMTLLPQDLAGWARSLTLRNIQLPPDVKDEFLILINEQRNSLKIR